MADGSRESVDAGCRRLTASWVRERANARREAPALDNDDEAEEVADVELCDFFETFTAAGADALLPAGVYTVRFGGALCENSFNAAWYLH